MGLARHAEHPDRGGRRHRPGRGLRRVLRHGRAAGRRRPGAGRGLRGQQVPRRRVACSRPGSTSSRELTGRPTYGVLPWHPDLWLDSEDALDLDGRRSADRPARCGSPSCGCRGSATSPTSTRWGSSPTWTSSSPRRPRALADADLVVLPGTRATVADLAWLRERGLDRAIVAPRRARRAGARDLRRLPDARGPDRRPRRRRGRRRVAGAGAGAARRHHRRSARDKVLRLPTGAALGATTTGYEIHHGRVRVGGDEEFLGGARRARSSGPCGTAAWRATASGTRCWPRSRPRRPRVASVRRPVRRAPRGPAGPARRPGGEAPGRRRAAPARGCLRVTQATPRAHPCMRDSVSH